MPFEPTNISDEFKPGTGTQPCPECGQTCEIHHNIVEFGEWIYCDECRIRFERDRDPIDENSDDCYRCYECETSQIDEDYRLHVRTTPVGQFEQVETGIFGYDQATLRCPCGERYNGYLNLGETINCDCGRTLSLRVEN